MPLYTYESTHSKAYDLLNKTGLYKFKVHHRHSVSTKAKPKLLAAHKMQH